MALTVLVVGGGRVGAALARSLEAGGHGVTVVEPDPAAAEELAARIPGAEVVEADGTDPVVLEAAGIRTCDVVAAVTGDDAANVLVGALARRHFGVPRTVARVSDPDHAWMFAPETGIDVALDQAELLAGLIVEELSLGEVASLLKLRRGAFTLIEERVPASSRAAGRTVAELGLPRECVLLAVLRDDGVVACHGGTVLAVDDELLAIVPTGAAGLLADALAAERGATSTS